MKRHHDKPHSQTSSPDDEHAIDALYGLEPVYEPGGVGGNTPTQFVTISCPYCGEQYETQIDLSAGSFDYIEDCQVCCQPIELSVSADDGNELIGVTAQRADD